MASIRNNKNIQSAVASAVFVGLRAEHSHISKLHATNFYTDEDEDICLTGYNVLTPRSNESNF